MYKNTYNINIIQKVAIERDANKKLDIRCQSAGFDLILSRILLTRNKKSKIKSEVNKEKKQNQTMSEMLNFTKKSSNFSMELVKKFIKSQLDFAGTMGLKLRLRVKNRLSLPA